MQVGKIVPSCFTEGSETDRHPQSVHGVVPNRLGSQGCFDHMHDRRSHSSKGSKSQEKNDYVLRVLFKSLELESQFLIDFVD